MTPEYGDGRAPNKKVIYKLQKLKTASTVYFCECGNNYLSFPALYLHAKDKHHVKFTTKMSPEVCKIEYRGRTQVITYFINPITSTSVRNLEEQNLSSFRKKDEERDQSSSEKMPVETQYSDSVRNAIESYLSENLPPTMNFQRKSLYSALEAFTQENPESNLLQSQSTTDPWCRTLPCYFNRFVVDFLPQRFGKLWYQSAKNEVCSELFHFSNWLRSKKYTDLILIYSPTWEP